ncbi:hypothetical protein PHYSODRAFT_329949 [Phytophthora sojae]|uniref:Uncharacterized protein n=1 Tax=Phytophthora sojae (strain P6497) TaxID=1094619 RepID=G4ZBZ0_PHYSP|nr:hypothetical protein PHYSODRAFT_329949 [Phytophthora sojae]EGZ22091.1 hypothetical protein PHYSODRAFT_329949 [Phytophthora sojae]|eukprot:XP_009524808.1 hypothetical protein PHYSODRAFT_329949 [Phytophthora sojae]
MPGRPRVVRLEPDAEPSEPARAPQRRKSFSYVRKLEIVAHYEAHKSLDETVARFFPDVQNYVPTRFDDAPGRTIAKREVRFTNMPITADVVVDESNERGNSAVKKTSVGPVAGEGTGKQKRYGLNKDDVLLYERENIIMTDAFLAARSPRAKRVSVRSDDYDYNFVIPKNLVIKLDAVVKAEKAKRRTPASFGGNAEDEYPVGTVEEIVAFFPGGLPRFASGAVYNMKSFYNVRKLSEAWLLDMTWVSTTKWDKVSASPELFGEECIVLKPV